MTDVVGTETQAPSSFEIDFPIKHYLLTASFWGRLDDVAF
jgi:hypothetical protein